MVVGVVTFWRSPGPGSVWVLYMAAQEARPAELLASAELDAGCAEKEGRVSCL